MAVVLFDLDGTLLDSEKVAAQARSLGFQSVLGRTVTREEEAFFVGKPVRKVIAEMFPDHADHLSNEIRNHYTRLSSSILPYDGVYPMLQALKSKGYKMGIVSSKRNDNIERELELTGLASFFSVVVGQDDTEKHKPHPEPLLLAASMFTASPDNCIYIGDQPTDIEAAKRAGMKHIAAVWGEGVEERIRLGTPTCIASTPTDLLHLLSTGTFNVID